MIVLSLYQTEWFGFYSVLFIWIPLTDGWRLDVTLSCSSSKGALRNLVNTAKNSSPLSVLWNNKQLAPWLPVPYKHIQEVSIGHSKIWSYVKPFAIYFMVLVTFIFDTCILIGLQFPSRKITLMKLVWFLVLHTM